MNLNYEKTKLTKISDIEIPQVFFNRFTTGIDELDEMFGTGILPGSTITLKSLPGFGKSVFSLTLANKLLQQGYNVAYSSGEEDIRQLAYTCQRLGILDLEIGTITDVDELLEIMKEKDFLVVDSFQTLTTKKTLNSREQTKYFIDNLVRQAKHHNCTLLFIVQETSSGEIRGGTTLPYAVDVNIKITKHEEDDELRIFDVYKNRFGPTTKHEAKIGKTGYDFLGVYVEPEKEKIKQEKVSIKEVRKQQILEIEEPPVLNVQRVMNTLSVKEQTAKILLTELERDSKLVKYGRGQNAIWKILK